MKVSSNKKVVYVAMSGGVDSSVAAALLKEQGFDVVGVFMKPWQPETVSSIKYPVLSIKNRNQKIHNTGCLWQQDREDAMRTASVLGIPLLTWDFSKEYKKEVTDYMIREYKVGRTPNPDVMCNREIKFGLFLKKALKEGADIMATGHYVRIKRIKKIYKLYKSTDKNKDQSYFLWTLTQEQLKHCLFPVGGYTKPDVRKLAGKFGLPTAEKKDSQGVCFIGPLDMKEFLKRYIKSKNGKILDLNGSLVGTHDGACYYTIGQRHGLDIKNGKGPYYVVRKNLKRNIIYVGSSKDLLFKKMQLTGINWINHPVDNRLAMSVIHRIDVRVRYRARLSKAIINNNGKIVFEKPETAITPGQSAVFYRGDELVGGGIIR